MKPDPGEIKLFLLLRRWRIGDRQVEDSFFDLLMPDLHEIAERYFRGKRNGNSLQPTTLENEVFLHPKKSKNIDWQYRGNFLAISAKILRYRLLDRVRTVLLSVKDLRESSLGAHTGSKLAIAVAELVGRGCESPDLSLHTSHRDWYRAQRLLLSTY